MDDYMLMKVSAFYVKLFKRSCQRCSINPCFWRVFALQIKTISYEHYGTWNHWVTSMYIYKLFVQQLAQANEAENIKSLQHWCFVRGIHQWVVDSPHKGPVMWKAFPCHDAIMQTLILSPDRCQISAIITTANISPQITAMISHEVANRLT